MSTITIFLANPVVALTGYVLSLVAATIAIWQFIGKTHAIEELNQFKMEVANNSNNIQQGEKSQYFQENSGQVHIDNRG